MTQPKSKSVQELETILAELPSEKVQEVVDFASYLRHRYAPSSRRGSPYAILRALEETGPLQFEEGELDSLLSEIEMMRQLDLEEDD